MEFSITKDHLAVSYTCREPRSEFEREILRWIVGAYEFLISPGETLDGPQFAGRIARHYSTENARNALACILLQYDVGQILAAGKGAHTQDLEISGIDLRTGWIAFELRTWADDGPHFQPQSVTHGAMTAPDFWRFATGQHMRMC